MRYVRVPTVVEVVQLKTPIDLGAIGLGSTNDFLIQTASGSFSIMEEAEFATKFRPTSANTELTGSDVS